VNYFKRGTIEGNKGAKINKEKDARK